MTSVEAEHFTHAVINAEDRTITEYDRDDMHIYSLDKFLERWSGVSDIDLRIYRRSIATPDGRDDG